MVTGWHDSCGGLEVLQAVPVMGAAGAVGLLLWMAKLVVCPGTAFVLPTCVQYTVVLRAPGARVTEETSLAAALLINAAFITVRWADRLWPGAAAHPCAPLPAQRRL